MTLKSLMDSITWDDTTSKQAVTRVNAEQTSKPVMRESTRLGNGENRCGLGRRAVFTQPSRLGTGDGMLAQRNTTQHGKPQRWRRVTANRYPARAAPGRGLKEPGSSSEPFFLSLASVLRIISESYFMSPWRGAKVALLEDPL